MDRQESVLFRALKDAQNDDTDMEHWLRNVFDQRDPLRKKAAVAKLRWKLAPLLERERTHWEEVEPLLWRCGNVSFFRFQLNTTPPEHLPRQARDRHS